MKNIGSLVFFYAETPLHVGSGSGLGYVDLPIQRERFSGLPMVQGSGLKGAFREAARALVADHKEADLEERDRFTEANVGHLFGAEVPGDSSAKGDAARDKTFAGACNFVDARLLLLPLRTVKGGWTWATCPMILDRLARDRALVGSTHTPSWAGLTVAPGQAMVAAESRVVIGDALAIEEFYYDTSQDGEQHSCVKDLGAVGTAIGGAVAGVVTGGVGEAGALGREALHATSSPAGTR